MYITEPFIAMQLLAKARSRGNTCEHNRLRHVSEVTCAGSTAQQLPDGV
jgi:hypothetical protein